MFCELITEYMNTRKAPKLMLHYEAFIVSETIDMLPNRGNFKYMSKIHKEN